jgi:transcriptional regulator with XRE-family HTH domain
MSSPFKCARDRAGLTAADVARMTSLSPRTIAAIEEERYDELPAGIYARSFVRAYAETVGLDPDTILETLQLRLPEAPLDLLELAELTIRERPATRGAYAIAALIDTGVLLAIVLAILFVCSAFCGLTLFGLLRSAPGAMAILSVMPIALYFWLLGATGVSTVGPWLVGIEILPSSDRPLSFETWLRRGFLYAAREAKLAFTPA